MEEKDIQSLLSHTDSLLNQTFWFSQKFKIKPDKEHFATSITYTDVLERRNDFINCLLSTINSFVYSKRKSSELINKFFEETSDFGNASAKLTFNAKKKFRPGHPQGQFGELLLFNFIQHFFSATPVLRKMSITTSNKHERFGADAIHYKINSNGENVFFLGESKCYKTKYKFKSAFKDSLNSISKSFEEINDELDLYLYEDGMIDGNLVEIVEKLKSNTLSNVKFELVCIIIYHETREIDKTNETEIKERIKEIIEEKFKSVGDEVYDKIDKGVLERINYIVFPVWKLDNLLDEFMKTLGA
ncbi:HamA C-terminal domain-containing protein [Tenacibaculum sp. A30]|uniref:HamA C-terminal domain-containing protein n=1 Tax=Tenacibaculum sp. A30 TaxID=3442644 RepID=UPI003EB89E90